MAAYGAIHSLLASLRVKAWSQSVFGEWHDRLYRLFFNITGAITFLPVLAVAWLAPDLPLYRIQPPWLWLTLALQALAVVALFIGVAQTGASEFLGLQQLQRGETNQDEFVEKGLYRWVRHPLYTAGLVFIWLIPLMTTNLLALNLGLTLYLYVGSIFEEKKLVKEWGDTYRRYQQEVPRLIPRPWKHT